MKKIINLWVNYWIKYEFSINKQKELKEEY